VDEQEPLTAMHMNINAVRLLYRIISEAHDKWSGGPAEEQECLRHMKIQLWTVLMDNLLEE